MQGVAVHGGAPELAEPRARDEAAFEALIAPHLKLAHRLAATMLNDPDEAEDVVQEAALRAWRAFGRLRPESNVRAWFLTIIANQSRSRRRTRWWSTVRLANAEIALEASEVSDERRLDLLRALRNLSPDDRAVILLRFYEDMTSREVAAALGMTSVGVRSRITRALRRMRVALGEEKL